MPFSGDEVRAPMMLGFFSFAICQHNHNNIPTAGSAVFEVCHQFACHGVGRTDHFTDLVKHYTSCQAATSSLVLTFQLTVAGAPKPGKWHLQSKASQHK